jgi:hypothetical protein
MGIAVVLIFYAIAMTIAATIGAIVLGTVSSILTKHSGSKRKKAVLVSLFPFVCLVFAGVWSSHIGLLIPKCFIAIQC